MDEVFGSENFISLITFNKTSGAGALLADERSRIQCPIILSGTQRTSRQAKYRPLYSEKECRRSWSEQVRAKSNCPTVRVAPLTAEEVETRALPRDERYVD